MSTPKRILGIDPGSQSTGYGLIEKAGSRHTLIVCGCLRPKAEDFAARLEEIFHGINALIQEKQPTAIAVETQFVQKNVSSAMKLGMVRGIVLLAASLHRIELFEYAPCRAKQALTGSGKASKEQVAAMVRHLLNLHQVKLSKDASDAIMIALCHAFVNPTLLAYGLR